MQCIAPAASVAVACEVLVAVAQHDSPEFRRQSQEYGQVSSGQHLPSPTGMLLQLACSDLRNWDEELTSHIRAVFLQQLGGGQ